MNAANLTQRPAVGIDIGGTKFAAGLLSETGELMEFTERLLPTRSYADLVDLVASSVASMQVRMAAPAVVGVAVAAWLSPDRETVRQAVNLGWDSVPLRADVAERTGLPVRVYNDADSAAWAEWTQAGRPDGAFTLLTLGTDVGGGIIVNGELVSGAHGVAAELGHLTVRTDGASCVCGARGCLAAYASGTAMLARARELLEADGAAATILGQFRGAAAVRLTGAGLAQAAGGGDPVALRVVAEAAEAIGTASQQVSRVIDHSVLVLGGGASALGQPLVDAVTAAIAGGQPVGPVRPAPAVRLARTGNRAGVLGAAQLAEHALPLRPHLQTTPAPQQNERQHL